MNEAESSILIRHADKGKWQISEEELRQRLPENEANLVMTVLQEDFPDLKETTLKLDGIIRSLRLADKIFEEFPPKGVLVATDSGKDRAQLTRSLVTRRLAQLEAKDRKERGDKAKRIDMLQVDTKEITNLMADSSAETWGPYGEMIEKEGISESEAIALWLNDMNQPGLKIPSEIHPAESAQRYREVIKQLRSRVTSDRVPVVLLGVGHSGSLGQVRFEDELKGRPIVATDAPQFCEMFMFDNEGRLIGSKKVEIER